MSRDVTWMHLLFKDHKKEEEAKYREMIIENDDFIDRTINDDVKTQRKKIPRAVRELQTSYNDAEKAYKETLDEEGKAFMGFALASKTVTYPDKPSTFQEAWNHGDVQEREG